MYTLLDTSDHVIACRQEDFLAAVWDRDAGGVPPPSEAGYNLPEAVPAFQPQAPAALHPDYRQARQRNLQCTLLHAQTRSPRSTEDKMHACRKPPVAEFALLPACCAVQQWVMCIAHACSGKTVEEVWNSIHKSNGNNDGQQQGVLPGFQTVTLGSFLERVGVDFPSMDLQQNGLLPPAPELQVNRKLTHNLLKMHAMSLHGMVAQAIKSI